MAFTVASMLAFEAFTMASVAFAEESVACVGTSIVDIASELGWGIVGMGT